ncbi:MAG TPA: glycosyltransferase family 2 protein [Phnomibacter sp.]|nr:glycosyltransferase family 2 protein [Phnomibacter sp.]
MKVSVALCTYNGAAYVEEQLLTILHQSHRPDEIICCDDGSIDGTGTILENHAALYPSLFRVIQNENNLGPRKNFEKAISQCTGDIIFLCDQDDHWHLNKIEKMLGYFKEHPECWGLFCNGDLMNQAGESMQETMWDALYFELPLRRKTTWGNLYQYLLLNGNVATGTALAIRKETLNLILPFNLENQVWHDHWIAMVLAAMGRLHFIDECLLSYRVHAAQQVGFQGHGMSNPDFRNAVHTVWLQHPTPDPEGVKTHHLAWAVQASERWKKQLPKKVSGSELVRKNSDSILAAFAAAKKNWLQQLPFQSRKIKLLKHWLKGGEYLRISWFDIISI